MIIAFLKKEPDASRKDIDNLLLSLLPTVLSKIQKKKKVDNLLQSLARKNIIINKGGNANSRWYNLP